MKLRNSISGVKLRESDRLTHIEVNTLCPSKWVIVDTESGHVYGKHSEGGSWVTPTAATMRDARVCLTRALVSGEASKKERPVHGVSYTERTAHLACNKNWGMASGYEYTAHSELPDLRVTCKNCLRVLRCGQQMELQLQ